MSEASTAPGVDGTLFASSQEKSEFSAERSLGHGNLSSRVKPATGWTRISNSISGNLMTVTLPALSLSVIEVAVYTRVVRSDLVTTLKEDYILSARSKGLKDGFILFRHALRPSSLTLITVVGLNIGLLLGGTVVVEFLFALPGLGKRLLDAIFQRDFMMVQGITVFVAMVYVVVNTLVDFVYLVVDPRIRKAD